jgi:hypothetical protein
MGMGVSVEDADAHRLFYTTFSLKSSAPTPQATSRADLTGRSRKSSTPSDLR